MINIHCRCHLSKKILLSFKIKISLQVSWPINNPPRLPKPSSNLCFWASTRYERIPQRDIQNILKVSFDALDQEEKNVFLDITCCFKGYALADVEDILRARYGHDLKYHIEVLIDKSLINISLDGKVTTHPLIESMGKEIVRMESPADPGSRSRLWFSEDIFEVMENNTV